MAAADVSLLHSPVHHDTLLHLHDAGHHPTPILHAPVRHGFDHHRPSHAHRGSVAKRPKHVHHGNTDYGHEDYHDSPAHYDFEYVVHDEYSGNHFGHEEVRDGYKTSGQYFVHLPDGRVQTVTYYADETGYHPTVTYEGEAVHDVHAHAHGPAYHAPKPFHHAPVNAYH
ncbi:cuticle protein 7-like [Macrobrachium rosenbergii]|uniref:cuticle protein 7-like n=1 Tax=Macrobrachium rosenbergii TaxID=79674 RepID=UPI0034D73836